MAQRASTTTNSTTSTQQPKNAFLTYTNSTYGIKIQFPSNWLYKESNASNNSVQTIVSFDPSYLVQDFIELCSSPYYCGTEFTFP